MQISSILTEDRCQARQTDTSKKRLLESLAGVFAQSLPTANETELFQHFIGREKLGSTGIGDGIAIPHCRYTTGGETLCACITLENPIDFDAVDGKPVDLVFAMLVPEDAEESHLQTLATLAEALQNANYAHKLRSSFNSHELFTAATDVN